MIIFIFPYNGKKAQKFCCCLYSRCLSQGISKKSIQIYMIYKSKSNYNLKRNMKEIILSLVLVSLAASLVCEQGSVPNAQSVCISPKYIQGCNEFASENRCKVCNYRYVLLSNGLCDLDAQTTQDCCKVRASNEACSVCQVGLYLINGKCQESNILGCLQKDNKGICINCASGFILNSGICSTAIKNCLTYADQDHTICSSCASDHSLINNICVRNLVLGCRKQINHICTECYRPFYLNNGNCEIKNCKTYNEYKCIACECGFYLSDDGVCKKMELGCVRYQRGVCSDCLPNFKLKGSKCELEGCVQQSGLLCKTCDSSYTLTNGACHMKNCLSWKDGICLTCASGFNFKQGKCISALSLSSQ